MKQVFLAMGILTCSHLYAQDTNKQDQFEYFIAIYTIGDNWDTTKQAYEQPYFSEHSTHLAELKKANKISVGARYSDKGMLVLKVKDEAEAKRLVTNDTAIKNKLFKVEVHPLYPFYGGCIE